MNTPDGEETIFAEALRLSPEERPEYLAQATKGNAELRRRIEGLIGSYGAGNFLEEAAAPQLRQTLDATVTLTEKPGERIGRYKLLEQIGEGGCGVVYVAEQTEPVRRRVALKIIKLGMDTKSIIARFEAERQALALMDHPNIAKVFDAGTTETGRPYFVMELVRGMKITDYCDEKKLSTRERLDLFIQVCQAIQHAHQKGIIHRDIKPSNILVTVNDGVPVPKVIDFGIAKPTSGQQLTDKTIYTAFEQFIGTPAYMSPEQAVLTSLDIDTRSDIYALGVLLYELLTGKTPFDAKELLAIGLDEMRRTIREQEPQRPSTRLSTLAQNELSTTAQRRGLDAPKLVSELRGDLDWIVMKCIEKDRSRRYDTANGLAADILRHLNNEPVVACPPSRVYRFQKMVRRNKVAFAAGIAVGASLVIGMTMSAVLFFRERAARERADEQTALARAVNDFLERDLLRQASSHVQARSGFKPDPNLTVREALERAAERIGRRFKDQPLQEAKVRSTIGNALRDIGEAKRAIPHLQRSLELIRAHRGPTHQRTLDAMGDLAIAYDISGNFDQSLRLYEETLELMKATVGPTHRSTLGAMNNLAVVYERVRGLDRALPLYEETLELMKANLEPSDEFTLMAMNNVANSYYDLGRLEQATALYEETLKRWSTKRMVNHPDMLLCMNNLALAYRDGGSLDRALPLFEETLKGRKASLGPARSATLDTMAALANGYRRAGKLDQALLVCEELVKVKSAKKGPNHPDTLTSMHHLADAFIAVKNNTEAEAVYREALARFRASSSNGPPTEIPLLGTLLHHLADVLRKRHMFTEALSLAEEAMSLYHRHSEWPSHERDHALAVLQAVLRDQGASGQQLESWYRKELSLLREYVSDARKRYPNDRLKLAGKLYYVADLHYRQGNYVDSEPLYREITGYRRAALAADHPDLLDATASLARLLTDWAWAESTSKSEIRTLNSKITDRAREAERLMRDVLAARLRSNTNSWRIGDVKSRLGAALVSLAFSDPAMTVEARQAKLNEAESLLLEGHEQLQAGTSDELYKRDALQRLERLYEAWNKCEKRSEWHQKLVAFEKAQKNPADSEALTQNGSKTEDDKSE